MSYVAGGLDFRVILLVENELIRHGLEAMISLIPEVTLCDAGEVDSAPQGSSDWTRVLIADAHTWHTAAPGICRPGAEHEQPWTLLIGDAEDRRGLEGCASYPYDGFLLVSEVHTQSLTDALHSACWSTQPANRSGRPSRHQVAGERWALVPQPRPAALTPRETEVLPLLVSGRSNKQIARALGISQHGAKRLVASIMIKFGAPNRTAAAVIAVNHGLIPTS
ncbi:response regulator transcription factor [Streptomyces sp. NPDC048751]|uniref:response regulator transcription factor n=1 Tax=Streptomyces sp. NPDC048751 TaxID=3365591 RepID=UPI003722F13C